jgi:hypothetical protein
MSDGRWLLRRTWRRQLPLTFVLALLGGGLVLTALDHWVTGVDVMATGLAAGAVMRAALPRTAVGLLAVRHRAFDTVIMAGAAVAMVGLSTSLR